MSLPLDRRPGGALSWSGSCDNEEILHTTCSTRLTWKCYPAATVYCVVLGGWNDVGTVHHDILCIGSRGTPSSWPPVLKSERKHTPQAKCRGISHVGIFCGIITRISLQKNKREEPVIICSTNFTWIMFTNPVPASRINTASTLQRSTQLNAV
jgi:hypothetical protein